MVWWWVAVAAREGWGGREVCVWLWVCVCGNKKGGDACSVSNTIASFSTGLIEHVE